MKKLLIGIALFFAATFVRAQEYPKAILTGDYADPTILRDGADYYMTHSPFYYAPGFLIWHSEDLLHWEPICRAVPEYRGSAMAPDLIKYKGRFYLYYPADGTNFVVWADDIRGPWSKPIDLQVGGIDPGHVVGEDGKRYLFLSDGNSDMPLVQLADDGLSVVGPKKQVYAGWQFPKDWKTEGLWLESPKLTKHGEYFYLTVAEGGTAGPPTSHMAASARSKSVFGPWENSPYNPIVHTYSANDNWWSKGHGTLVDDVNGNWWIVYHAYANGYYTLGRQTLIEPIEWTKDGWFRTRPSAPAIDSKEPLPAGLQLSDDFSKPQLGLQWTFWKEYATDKISLQNRTLSVEGKGDSPANGRLLLTTATDKNYEIQTEITVGKENTAGLLLFYNEKAYAGLVSDGKTFTIYKSASEKLEQPNKIGKHFFARIHNQGQAASLQVSPDGKSWISLVDDVDVSTLHHNNFGGFYALRPALVSLRKGKAAFRQFRYQNTVPQEKNMAAYLMVFHKDDTHSLHMALSPDGYRFTALNDGKPVIAGDTIASQKGIRDPHIYRGPDGAFYLAMTDLHIFAKDKGYRATEWERDGKVYGWGNNRGLVLMKSWDLVHWKRTNIELDKLSSAFSEIGCAWAPEVTFDEKKGKLMIYFTMRFRNEPNKLYYAYVNNDFDKLETLPQVLFVYPDQTKSVIDADITKIGNQYRMFYVAHDGTPRIKQAVSDKANGDYVFDPRWYDFEEKACEAPHVWKRIGQDSWVLMYDCYGLDKHNFGFAETSDFVHFTDLGHFNEGMMKATNFESPKHGAIVQLTREEAEKLANYGGLSFQALLDSSEAFKPNRKNPVLSGSYADPEVLYAEQTKQYYIYPTSDGFPHWSGTYFKTFSSKDLKNWKDEGVILDLKKDVSWAKENAWAPCIVEKKDNNGKYKYYYYFTAGKRIGVAVADHPTGPFKDSGKPLITDKPEGISGGQNIDPDIFTDPKTGKNYLYWGNGFMAVCELNDDMVSVKPNTTKTLIPSSPYYSEGTYVFYRNGYYYVTWSNNDTRSPNYQVRYIKTASPTEPIDPSKSEIILSKSPEKGIYATGHHSIIRIPEKDQWYIVYHRFIRPNGIKMGRDAGYNREVCIDKLEFNKDGTIKKVVPTL